MDRDPFLPCLGLDDPASTLAGQQKETRDRRNLLYTQIEILAKQDVQVAAPCFTSEVRTPPAIPNPNPARVSREGRSSADRVRGAAV